MRLALALSGALALAGCAGADRVTLLEPLEAGKGAGAVAVIDPDRAGLPQSEYEALETSETDLAVLAAANQQAQLRRGRPNVRQLDAADPAHAELIANLPLEVSVGTFGFETGAGELSEDTLDQLAAFLDTYVRDFGARYANEAEKPELHVEITGFADADGYADLTDDEAITQRNIALSARRANSVYYQLLERVGTTLPIVPEQIEVVPAGDYAALRASNGVRGPNPAFRVVTVTVR